METLSKETFGTHRPLFVSGERDIEKDGREREWGVRSRDPETPSRQCDPRKGVHDGTNPLGPYPAPATSGGQTSLRSHTPLPPSFCLGCRLLLCCPFVALVSRVTLHLFSGDVEVRTPMDIIRNRKMVVKHYLIKSNTFCMKGEETRTLLWSLKKEENQCLHEGVISSAGVSVFCLGRPVWELRFR